MGRPYYQHMGGDIVYHCVGCGTSVTNSESLVKREVFPTLSGGAYYTYLFKKVVPN